MSIKAHAFKARRESFSTKFSFKVLDNIFKPPPQCLFLTSSPPVESCWCCLHRQWRWQLCIKSEQVPWFFRDPSLCLVFLPQAVCRVPTHMFSRLLVETPGLQLEQRHSHAWSVFLLYLFRGWEKETRSCSFLLKARLKTLSFHRAGEMTHWSRNMSCFCLGPYFGSQHHL